MTPPTASPRRRRNHRPPSRGGIAGPGRDGSELSAFTRVNRMRRSLHYARPLDYAGPVARNRPRELLGCLASTAAVAVVGFCLLSVVVPKFDGGRRDVGGPSAHSDVATLSTMLDAFAADTGRYPTDAEG